MTTRKHPHEPPEEDMATQTASLEAKIAVKTAELESALAESKDRHLRLAADFDNYKKRSRQEQLETIQHASAELIGRLLPVLDDLHNVLDHMPARVDESWAKGLQLSVFAAEPDFVNPVCFTFDEKGRAYVVETHRLGNCTYDIRGHMAWVDDDLAFVRPWEFELENITAPVLVVQGRQDLMVPWSHGEWLARNLPAAESWLREDQGHLTLFVSVVPAIQEWLLHRF